MKAFLRVDSEGNVDWTGTEHAAAKLHHVSFHDGNLYAVVKFARRRYWASRGQQEYTGSEIVLFRVVGVRTDGLYVTEFLLRLPVRAECPGEELARILEAGARR